LPFAAGRLRREGKAEERAGAVARPAAARAARHRAPPADPQFPTPARRHAPVTARAPGADASRSVSRGTDVAGDSWARAGRARALARLHRSGQSPRARRTGRGSGAGAATEAAPSKTPAVPSDDVLTVLPFEFAHERDERFDAFFRER